MLNVRKFIGVPLLIAFLGSVQAQPSGEESSTLELGASAGVNAKLSPAEMERQAGSLLGEIQAAHDRVVGLQKSARDAKDIIKLNCINDKLLQLKQLFNIAEDARASLGAAISSQDEGERYHQFTVVTVSTEKTRILRDEADACIGEELMVGGGSTVDVDAPDVVDDPTRGDPFTLSGFELERPTYATPYL